MQSKVGLLVEIGGKTMGLLYMRSEADSNSSSLHKS